MIRAEISVIIPVYNRAGLIMRAILSVISQRNVTVELVIIDDCSTDETWEVLTSLRAENPHLRLICLRTAQHSGPAVARNLGLDAATAPLVAFLDSDDMIADPDVMSDMAAQLTQDSLDMLVAPFVIDEQSRSEEISAIHLPRPVCDARTGPELANMRSLWQALYSRPFLDRAQLRFAQCAGGREDRPFILAAVLAADRIGVFKRVGVRYFSGAAGSLTDLADLAALRDYAGHLQVAGATLEAARATGRVSADFDLRNAVLYASAQIDYWRDAWLEALHKPAPLVHEMLNDLARILRPSGPLYELSDRHPHDPIARQAGQSLMSGRLDLFKLGVLRGDLGLVRASLRNEFPVISDLYAMALSAGADTGTRAAIARVLSFLGQRLPAPARRAPRDLGALVPRIILHVGAMKTGSSALQNTLEANRFALIEQGFFYPATGTRREPGIRAHRNPGHSFLIAQLIDPARRDDALIEMEEEISALPKPPHTMILSAETILSTDYWLNRKDHGFEQICDAIGGQIDVVWIHREAESWLASVHREWLGNPRRPYMDTPQELKRRFAAVDLLDPDQIASTLQRPGNVRAVHRGHHEEIRAGEGITALFCRKAGIDARQFRPIPTQLANLSLSDDQVEMVTLLKLVPGLSTAMRDEGFDRIVTSRSPIEAETFFLRFLADVSPHAGEITRERHLKQGYFAPPGSPDLFLIGGGVYVLRLPATLIWSAVSLGDHDLPPLRSGGQQVVVVDSKICETLPNPEIHLRSGKHHETLPLRIEADHAGSRQILRLQLTPSFAGPAAPVLRRLTGTDAAPRTGKVPDDPVWQDGLTEVLLPGAASETDIAQAFRNAVANGFMHPLSAKTIRGQKMPWLVASTDIPYLPVDPVALAPEWTDFFDAGYYLRQYPDVARAGVNPARHYQMFGANEGRLPVPQWQDGGNPRQFAFKHAVATACRVLVPSRCFAGPEPTTAQDPATTAKPQPHMANMRPVDLIARHMDLDYYNTAAATAFADKSKAALHYLRVGWKAGCDPHPEFSGQYYLDAHPDVAAAGVAPYAHFLKFGISERRAIAPSGSSEAAQALPWDDLERARQEALTFDPAADIRWPLQITSTLAAGRALVPGFRKLLARAQALDAHILVITKIKLSPEVVPSGVMLLGPDDLAALHPVSWNPDDPGHSHLIVEFCRAARIKTIISTPCQEFSRLIRDYGRQLAAERRVIAIEEHREPSQAALQEVINRECQRQAEEGVT